MIVGTSHFDNHFHAEVLSVISVVDRKNLVHLELVISGFDWETVSNTIVTTGDRFPPAAEWRTRKHCDGMQPHVYIPIYVAVAEEMLTKADGVQPEYVPEGVKPTVPLRALLAEGVDHLLMAGRCLSADRMAMSAIRVQAASMSTGQAAGEAAAQAALARCSPRALDIGKIKAGLRTRGCVVP